MADDAPLGEVAQITMGQSPPGNTYNSDGEGLPFFQGVADFGTRHPMARVYCSAPTRIAIPGDIMFSVRAPIGRVNIANIRCATGRGLAIIRPRDPKDARYIEFVLRSLERSWSRLEGGGSVFGNATKKDLETLAIPWPEPMVRRAVGEVLACLDDKIELNRRMAQTLEEMARALFKSWFVDFDPVRSKAEGRDPGVPKHLADLFPDRFVDSELGEIPDGWRVSTLGDHVENLDSKRVPLSGAVRSRRQGVYPYHGAAGVLDHIDDFLFEGVHVLVGEDGSVLRSEESGLAVTQYVWGKFWVNNHAHVLRGKGEVSSEQVYLYFDFVPIAPYVTGAVQAKLSQGRMNLMPFVFPGATLCAAFANIVVPLFARIRHSRDEANTLEGVRNALLAKLVSGEVRLPDPEALLARLGAVA